MFKKGSDKGFTLVELLVVVLIIAVLAAVAIPVFINQKAGAEESAVKSDLASAAKVLNAALADGTATLEGIANTNDGKYAAGTEIKAPGVSAVNLSHPVTVEIKQTSGSTDGYCVYTTDGSGAAGSGKINGKYFIYDSKKGSAEKTTAYSACL